MSKSRFPAPHPLARIGFRGFFEGTIVVEFSGALGWHMNQHRNRTWSDVPVVIDAANVAGDEHLPGCGKFCWNRVDLVKKAWKKRMDSDATFVVFMDTSPAEGLGECCKRRYKRERESGKVIEVKFADPEILLMAESTDAAVITGDFYKDARREHPWLDGNQDQFFEWRLERGDILIIPRDMGTPSEFSKTRSEERSELKGKGADISRTAVKQALRMAYRCDNESCWLRKYDPGHYTGVPDLQDPLKPRCNACRKELTILGDAPRLVQLKFANSERTKLERRTFPPSTSLVIGRETSDELVSIVLGVDRGLISRHHAQLDWDGSHLSLTDLDSKNGTTVRRWAGKQHGYEPAVPVNGIVSLRSRDEVCLAGILLITRSARTFVLESDFAQGRPAGVNPSTVPQDGLAG